MTIRDVALRQQDIDLAERKAKLAIEVLRTIALGGNAVSGEAIALADQSIKDFLTLE